MAVTHTVTTADKTEMKTLTPMKAIRLKCLDCSAGSAQEVRLCPIKDCALWVYRLGKKPKGGAE